jgi:hypothetical protein
MKKEKIQFMLTGQPRLIVELAKYRAIFSELVKRATGYDISFRYGVWDTISEPGQRNIEVRTLQDYEKEEIRNSLIDIHKNFSDNPIDIEFFDSKLSNEIASSIVADSGARLSHAAEKQLKHALSQIICRKLASHGTGEYDIIVQTRTDVLFNLRMVKSFVNLIEKMCKNMKGRDPIFLATVQLNIYGCRTSDLMSISKGNAYQLWHDYFYPNIVNFINEALLKTDDLEIIRYLIEQHNISWGIIHNLKSIHDEKLQNSLLQLCSENEINLYHGLVRHKMLDNDIFKISDDVLKGFYHEDSELIDLWKRLYVNAYDL